MSDETRKQHCQFALLLQIIADQLDCLQKYRDQPWF